MARVAFCLFGIVGGRRGKNGKGGYIDYELCYEHYKKHLIDVNNTDVYIHTWTHELKDELTKLYKPKRSIFQKQINFRNPETKDKKRREGTFRSKSRWYSNREVLNLVRDEEKKEGFKYDFVMVGRIDLMLLKDWNFDEWNPKNFYAANWNVPPLKRKGGKNPVKKINISIDRAKSENAGFADLWFASNSDYMNQFGKLYDKLDNYPISQHKSSWHHVHSFVPQKRVAYKFYRWFDFELYRWKVEGIYE